MNLPNKPAIISPKPASPHSLLKGATPSPTSGAATEHSANSLSKIQTARFTPHQFPRPNPSRHVPPKDHLPLHRLARPFSSPTLPRQSNRPRKPLTLLQLRHLPLGYLKITSPRRPFRHLRLVCHTSPFSSRATPPSTPCQNRSYPKLATDRSPPYRSLPPSLHFAKPPKSLHSSSPNLDRLFQISLPAPISKAKTHSLPFKKRPSPSSSPHLFPSPATCLPSRYSRIPSVHL